MPAFFPFLMGSIEASDSWPCSPKAQSNPLYRQGKDVQQRLPVLSTYLGHAHVTDTYWYLTSTPELIGVAGKRMEERWGGLL